MQAPTRSKQRGSYYLACLPEFAASTAFASQASVIQRSVSKSLRYERTLTLAWREATLRARPVLGKVIAELKRELPKRL